MQLGLSNNLCKSGLSNPDRLSLDLQFAEDKTLTARKGPTPVFTRGTNATYVGSNGLIQYTTGIHQPRFDHDPITLACKGLLIEDSRTNSISRSGEMNLWGGAGGSTRSVSTVLSPDGTSFATLATSGGSAFGGIVARSLTSLTSVIGTQYTASCFVKKGNYRYVSADYGPIRPSGTNIPFFDLDTLVFNANGSTTTGSIVSFPNGWYRLVVSGAAVIASYSTIDVNLTSSSGSGQIAVAGNTILVWGAQLEQGSFATSYIPTTTGAGPRSADVCSISGANFSGIWNGVDATVFFRGSRIANISGQINWSLSSGTLATTLVSERSVSSERLTASGVGIISRTLFTTLQEYKTATAVKSSDFAISYNGETVLTAAVPYALSLNSFIIGNSYTGGGQLNGWINSIKFYKKRLTNAKLQSLTA